MREFYIVTFNNTHEAMQAEALCVNKNLKVTMMPTPTYITKSCGISLKVELKDEVALKSVVSEENLSYKTIYELKENKLREVSFKEN